MRINRLPMWALMAVLFVLVSSPGHCQDVYGQGLDAGSHDHHSGLFNMIFSPLRATINQARRLINQTPLQSVSNVVTDSYDQVQMQAFRMFTSLYNKTYSPEEIPRRMALFFERRKEIEKSARDFVEGRLPFMMRENAFIDWDETELKALTGVSPPRSFSELTPEERQAVSEPYENLDEGEEVLWTDNDLDIDGFGRADGNYMPKLRRVRRSVGGEFREDNMVEDGEDLNITVKQNQRIPASKDWRTSGCISTPINQLKCGACYAIASMSVVESMRCLNQVSSPILAPQQVVDCATPRAGYENYGCDGGWPTRVLKYLQNVGVAARESCYPFVRRQLDCRIRKVSAVAGCTVNPSPSDSVLRYKVLNNERDILYHVAKTGPVVTVMRATDRFLYYGSGIFDDPKCSRKRDDVDHAIVIVGYGRENGNDYWIIKNSWGTTDWGQGGYGKYRRGTNACSIGHWGWVITS